LPHAASVCGVPGGARRVADRIGVVTARECVALSSALRSAASQIKSFALLLLISTRHGLQRG
jgi:hypothetical protein